MQIFEKAGISLVSSGLISVIKNYFGEDINNWPIERLRNLSEIIKNSNRKEENFKTEQNGKLPPKTVKILLKDATWCSDEVQYEYFGGVLATSKTLVDRDDRGHYYSQIINNLSTYQLRGHFLFYHLLRNNYLNDRKNINDSRVSVKMKIYLPMKTYYDAFVFSEQEIRDENNILSHIMFGLRKENLLDHISWGHNCKTLYSKAEKNGIIFSPTRLGIELFMWAQGYGGFETDEFFKEKLNFRKGNINIGKSYPIDKLKN